MADNVTKLIAPFMCDLTVLMPSEATLMFKKKKKKHTATLRVVFGQRLQPLFDILNFEPRISDYALLSAAMYVKSSGT